ncbi:glucose-repressible protein Grg1, partial [Aspergillus similis]
METVKNAVNYVSESVQGAGASASKETNKNVAKDSDASLTSRATAAKDAVVDKKDEKTHDAKADVHKGRFIPSRLRD